MLDIPYEEIFFFIIQTYNTSLLYIILTKPTFQPAFLRAETVSSNFHGFVNLRVRRYKLLGQVFFGAAITVGLKLVKDTGNGTYAGLILLWAVPILLLLWYIVPISTQKAHADSRIGLLPISSLFHYHIPILSCLLPCLHYTSGLLIRWL